MSEDVTSEEAKEIENVENPEQFAEAVVQALKEKLREEAIKYVIREAAMKISKYVQLLGKEFKIIPGAGLLVSDSFEDVKVDVIVIFRPPEWIEIKTILATPQDISPEAARECRVYENLLRLSNDFPELTFCIDPNYNIIARQNILVGALSFDVFREEYDAVLASAYLFRRKLLPALKKCIKDYEEIRDALETDIT